MARPRARRADGYVGFVFSIASALLACSSSRESEAADAGRASSTSSGRGAGAANATSAASSIQGVATSSASSGSGGSGGTGGAPKGLSVDQNQLLKDGAPFRVHGVNRSGTEYACIEGWGIFDGPSDDASIQAIADWNANAVRIPFNEDCWLAINGAPAGLSGDAYKQTIHDYVARLGQHGLVAILELHWTAAGAVQATAQAPMPNQDHSIAFWADVAASFKGEPNTIFELFNEPFPDNNQDTPAGWACWRDGGDCPGLSYKAAGMQSLVDAVRGAGATNPIVLGGLEYANALTGWLAYAPADPLTSLVAAVHIYDFNLCKDTACFDETLAPLAAKVPLIATEIGEQDCAGGFIGGVMQWFDAHGAGYLGWTWDAWPGQCLVLITDYAGTPNGAYGQTFKDHLALFP